MPAPRVAHRWTMVTWCIDRAIHDVDAVVAHLETQGADMVALQWLRRGTAVQIAEDLDMAFAWEFSYHPAAPLITNRGRGLAVLTPHSIDDSVSFVTNNSPSPWSRRRRIAQFCVVGRQDGASVTIGHAGEALDPEQRGDSPAPLVWFRPTVVSIDPGRAVDLPSSALSAAHHVRTPVSGAAPAFTVSFELPVVTSDDQVGAAD